MADPIVPVEADISEFAPAVQVDTLTSGMVGEAARAQTEIQAAVVMARRFPRDQFQAVRRITDACKREKLAKEAMYAYPRGGQTVTGPSIRLAEVLAQCWGNIRFGISEIERRDDASTARAWAWDLETNMSVEITFDVPHERHTQKGSYRLTDPRDIYEVVANNGSRRLRACILRVIPGDVQEIAVNACRATIAAGGGRPLQDRVRQMVLQFGELGVPPESIERRLGHKLDLTTSDELVDLIAVFKALKDGAGKRQDYFDLTDTASEDTKELTRKFKSKGEA